MGEPRNLCGILNEILDRMEDNPEKPQGLETYNHFSKFNRASFCFFYAAWQSRLNFSRIGNTQVFESHVGNKTPFCLYSRKPQESKEGTIDTFLGDIIWVHTSTIPYDQFQRRGEKGLLLIKADEREKGFEKRANDFVSKNKYSLHYPEMEWKLTLPNPIFSFSEQSWITYNFFNSLGMKQPKYVGIELDDSDLWDSFGTINNTMSKEQPKERVIDYPKGVFRTKAIRFLQDVDEFLRQEIEIYRKRAGY